MPPRSREPRTIVSSDLAQSVVERLAPLVRHNINIIDEHGLIIASLQSERIGTHHHGAQEALRRGAALSITSPEPGTGDRPGANELLVIDGRVCGVVGITGDPYETAPIARIVATTVELLIAREHERDRALARQTSARDLLAALASGSTGPEEAGALLDALDLHAPWRLSITCGGATDRATPPEGAGQRAEAVTAERGAAAAVIHGGLWILRSERAAASARPPDGDPSTRTLTVTASDVGELLARAGEARALSGYPSLFPTPAETADPGAWHGDLAVAVACMPVRSIERLARRAHGWNAEHARILAALAEATSAQDAARRLHLHRNTLLQRIDRMRETSGLDPRRPAAITQLLLAVYAQRALGNLHT